MAKAIKAKKKKEAIVTERFSAVVDVRGSNAGIIKEGLENKMQKETRKSYANAIEAILIEYFSKQ